MAASAGPGAAGLRRLAAVEAERDQLRQRVEALTDDALARVMVASETAECSPEARGQRPRRHGAFVWAGNTDRHTDTRRDQLRAEVEALRADADLLSTGCSASLWMISPLAVCRCPARRRFLVQPGHGRHVLRQDAARGNARRAQGLIPIPLPRTRSKQ